jgi:hypothetical protein
MRLPDKDEAIIGTFLGIMTAWVLFIPVMAFRRDFVAPNIGDVVTPTDTNPFDADEIVARQVLDTRSRYVLYSYTTRAGRTGTNSTTVRLWNHSK